MTSSGEGAEYARAAMETVVSRDGGMYRPAHVVVDSSNEAVCSRALHHPSRYRVIPTEESQR